MSNPCSFSGSRPLNGKSRISELISWRLLKKNPSGALIWGIFGAAVLMDSYFVGNFFVRKEYQVHFKERMWNERVEMLEKPAKMKMYYTSEEAMPKPSQPLADVYEKMRKAEQLKCEKIMAYVRSLEAEHQS